MSNEHQLLRFEEGGPRVRWICKKLGCGWNSDEPNRDRARIIWRDAHEVTGETKSYHYRIPSDIRDPAAELAAKKGETLADVVRRAFIEYVEKELAS